MAYCVHCGVRLEEGARRCPLCQTPVHDPSAGPQEKPAERAYPVHTPEQALKKNKLYLLNWAVLLLLLPALLCLVLDFLTGEGISWSIYAAGALILLFISAAVPLLVSRHRVYWSLLASFRSLNGYLFLAERVSDRIACVKAGCIQRVGAPGEIFSGNFIDELYDLPPGTYRALLERTFA